MVYGNLKLESKSDCSFSSEGKDTVHRQIIPNSFEDLIIELPSASVYENDLHSKSSHEKQSETIQVNLLSPFVVTDR